MPALKECYINPYSIPRLFVEDTGIADNEYLVLDPSENKATLVKNKAPKKYEKVFSKVLYGSLLGEIIDTVAQRVVRDFIVVMPPSYKRGLYVPKQSKIVPIPMEGFRVSLEICEGMEISKGETIGYIVTKKGEIRHIRSHVYGVISYIYSDPASTLDKYIVFISPKEEVRFIEIR